ncbi:cupin domain-containing protein [Variovorax sp.]|uniref:cupin domain-containing protein n=1 Tax=Variovorax sp. TaxID=1871043 RepID=UPI002D25C772|nr:cupin domain-containing protein [Variovorax sp.]HYP84793.1 cupin domain-containing protein [Variovorax sp.]
MESKFKKYKINDDITLQVISYSDDATSARLWFTGPGFPSTHHHLHTETNVVVSGEFEATSGDRVYKAAAGETVRIESNVEHNMKCLTPTAEMISSWTPARQDLIEKYTELA